MTKDAKRQLYCLLWWVSLDHKTRIFQLCQQVDYLFIVWWYQQLRLYVEWQNDWRLMN
jgi:hypothetical protein